MKRSHAFAIGLAIGSALLATQAVAVETVTASTTFTWSAPTANTDGSPLTNLKGYQIFAGTAPIPDVPTGSPAVEAGPGATSVAYSTTVPNGSTLHARIRACNTEGTCSSLSNQLTKQIKVVVPGLPEGFAVTVTVTVVVPAK